MHSAAVAVAIARHVKPDFEAPAEQQRVVTYCLPARIQAMKKVKPSILKRSVVNGDRFRASTPWSTYKSGRSPLFLRAGLVG